MNVTGNQIMAARALAGIEQTDLASAAKVSINTVRNMEAAAGGGVRVRLETLIRVRDALLAKGVRLVGDGDTSGGGSGVRLQAAPQIGIRPENLTSANDD